MDNQYLLVPQYDFRHQTISVTNVQQQILNSDVRRIGLYFSTPSTINEIWVSPHVITGVNQGFTIFSNSLPLRFTFEEDGLIPTLEWWAIGNAAAEDLYVLEILFNPYQTRRNQT